MRSNWILSPEARQKLVDVGLMRRIEDTNDKHDFDVLGFTYEEDVVGGIQDMRKRGLFDTIPEGERRAFLKSLQAAWGNREKACYVVKRLDGDHEVVMDNEDFLLLSGLRSSLFLSKEELFDYKRFGFSSVGEFAGTVGAAIEVTMGRGLDRGAPVWQTKRPDGRVIASTITGDGNGDFRIIQRDLTPYETKDPLGNKVMYRPEDDVDRMGVAGDCDVEGIFLFSALKYIDQTGLKPKTLENGAAETISWAAEILRKKGFYAESFEGPEIRHFSLIAGWPFPYPG